MANPTRSLNDTVTWLRILPALGVMAPGGILPATTKCPLCHGDKFLVVNDQILGGQWCSCRDCKFAGDLLELVGRAWNVGIPAALVRLDELDLLNARVSPESAEAYVRDHIQLRLRLNQFWENAQQQIKRPKSYSLSHLLKRNRSHPGVIFLTN